MADGLLVVDFAEEVFFEVEPERAEELFAVDFAPPEAFFAVDLPAVAFELETFLLPVFAAPVDLELDDFAPVDLELDDLAPVDLAVDDFAPPVVFFADDLAPPLAFLVVAFLAAADLLEPAEVFEVDFFAVGFEAGLAVVFLVVDDAFFGAAFEFDFDEELFEAAFFGAAFFGAGFFFVAMWSSRDQKISTTTSVAKIEISMRKKLYCNRRKNYRG